MDLDPDTADSFTTNPISKPKIVVIIGASGSGKSKLVIDLASYFPIEIINAESMQVDQGLDVLTRKVPHKSGKECHIICLGLSVQILNSPPKIFGNMPFCQYLLNDFANDLEANCSWDLPCSQHIFASIMDIAGLSHFGDNKDLDCELEPISAARDLLTANRIHPNDHRKGRTGVLYAWMHLCKHWIKYVNQRLDHILVEAGLVEEVCDIHKSDSDYTRGLRQAIGVLEFDDFLRYRNSDCLKTSLCPKMHKDNLCECINSSCGNQSNFMLKEAIDKVKLNTKRLVRQKRRLNQLQMLFGWKIHYLDVTSCIS